MCNTSRTDIAATNNIMDNTSTYSENETMATSRSHNATNNTQHTVNMTNSEHHGMRLLVPVQKANNNTAVSGQPLANNYLQNDVVDIFTNNCRADSNESNVLNTNTLQQALKLGRWCTISPKTR